MATVEQANELYEDGLRAFREGDNARCISLTTASWKIGKQMCDHAVVGQALTGLCRAALRDHDEDHLHTLIVELADLADTTGDGWWRVVIAHVNAEMARMKGRLSEASDLYDESMRLSSALGKESMVATECFNKSLVALAQDNATEARLLLQRHFAIRDTLDEGALNPYGLIGVASLLVAEGKMDDAGVTAHVCRRLFADAHIIPDPADEAPLQSAEEACRKVVSPTGWEEFGARAARTSCRELVTRFLK